MNDQQWIVGDGESVPATPDPTGPASRSNDVGEGDVGAADVALADDRCFTDGVADAEIVDDEPLTEIEVLAAERDEYLLHLQRLQADFDNFRKRSARDQAALSQRASERLVEELLPVLDAFDLAMMSVVELPDEHAKVKKGIELTYAQMVGVLEKAGLQRVDALDQAFDPSLHDAVMQVDEGRDEPVVVEVMRAGYHLKGRVLRAAMVKVAK